MLSLRHANTHAAKAHVQDIKTSRTEFGVFSGVLFLARKMSEDWGFDGGRYDIGCHPCLLKL